MAEEGKGIALGGLRGVVLDLLRVVKTPTNGAILTIDTDEHGKILVTNVEKELHIQFEKYDRLFVLTKDNLLVERVKIPPPEKEKPLSPLEEEFVTLIKEDNYPDSQGETIPVLYKEDDSLCLVTRTPSGIIGEFINEGVKLFYDLRSNKVRPYRETDTRSPQREVRVKKEKEETAIAPDMVEQLGYKGEREMVDRNIYRNKFVCECGRVRWIKNSDVFQVHSCKVCMCADKRKKGKKA
jgi:hypothetical protein